MSRILVTDDDATVRESIRKVLEREGHCVDGADGVDSALSAMRIDHFDLVLCDYRMPGKTGMDLLVELKRTDSRVPVVIISAYADAATEEQVLGLGAVDILRKPIRRQELIERMARLVKG